MSALRNILAAALIGAAAFCLSIGDARAQSAIANYCFNPNGSQATNNQWLPCPAVATITGNATGTTGAVVGTLAAAPGKFTYICGFNVSSVGGTAPSSPITVAGIVGSSQVYQTPINATGGQILVSQNFIPCIPSSAANTAITITTTAASGATAVDVNSWGFQQ
jgi:hypothetical protein